MAGEAPKINFDTKHLKKGDSLPPFTGKLRLYNMRYCPYAQRTVLALNAKKIDYEVVNINLMDKPEWLTTKSSFGKVPALEIADGVTIYESLITVNYIDDVYPQRPLRTRDPLRHAHDQILIEAIGPVQSLVQQLARTPDTVDEAVLDAYFKTLDLIQKELNKRRTPFLGGAELGYADYMIWPWIERILVYKDLNEKVKFDTPKYIQLAEYVRKMTEDPAVSQYAVPAEIHSKLRENYRNGIIDLDIMTK